jgi:uncharacterized protein (DUF302 family)
MKQIILAAALAISAQMAPAQGIVTYTTDQSFEDVIFGLESAILDKGLVVDAVSRVGAMLERTREDIGSDVVIFTDAEVYSFCSAKLSRQVMEVNPMNIRFCPYDIFVAQMPDTPDSVTIGYRAMPEGEMQVVQALLDEIARTAISE